MKRRRNIPQFDLPLPDEPFRLVGQTAPDPDRLRQEQETRERIARERAQFEAQAQTTINWTRPQKENFHQTEKSP